MLPEALGSGFTRCLTIQGTRSLIERGSFMRQDPDCSILAQENLKGGEKGLGAPGFSRKGLAGRVMVQAPGAACVSSLPSSRALRLCLSFNPLKVSSPAYRVPIVSALKESFESSFICFVATSHNLRR